MVTLRIEINDEARRALRRAKGEPGLATRYEVRSIVECAFEQALEAAMVDASKGRG